MFLVDKQCASNLSDNEIDLHLSGALEAITRYVLQEKKKESEIKRVLIQFPRLKEIATLSKLETTLREDGHHHIVRHQRKLARLMLDAAAEFPAIFDTPDSIFDISTDELIALFGEDNSEYINQTFIRWQWVEEAEKLLKDEWGIDPQQAFKGFQRHIRKAQKILDVQQSLAHDCQIKRHYQKEKARLQYRVDKLKIGIGV
jgi:hypothetical protein